jgi:hypothetical protein
MDGCRRNQSIQFNSYIHTHPSSLHMSLVPARDHLGEFLLLLESTNGRDKLCRLVQYSSKFIKWRGEVEKKEEQIKVKHVQTNGYMQNYMDDTDSHDSIYIYVWCVFMQNMYLF